MTNYLLSRPHFSFSEISKWINCPYYHKLKYVDGIDLFETSPQIIFGTAIHLSIEHFTNTKIMDENLFINEFTKLWNENKQLKSFEPHNFDEYLAQGKEILSEYPNFIEENFPGWIGVTAEEELYETIIPEKSQKFKGYIDTTLKVDTLIRNKSEERIWILDTKTTTSYWDRNKIASSSLQLTYYKKFWSQKHDIDKDIIRCGFILLKRKAKSGNHCQLIDVSVGPEKIKKSLNVIDNMMTALENGITPKNRLNCKYCEFLDTDHCKLL